jgi:hypothetical protein
MSSVLTDTSAPNIQRLIPAFRRGVPFSDRIDIYLPSCLLYLCFINNKKSKKMKATTIIIAALLSFQINVLFAHNDEPTSTLNNEAASFNMSALEPVTPAEANFEDETETNAFNFDLSVLAPENPVEADFSDVVPEKNIDLSILAPVTPAEAEFNDDIENLAADLTSLAPVTPAEADFE